MKRIVLAADRIWLLESSHSDPDPPKPRADTKSRSDARRLRRHLWEVTPSAVAGYLPSEDSLFDEDLAPDLDLTKQVVPTSYEVPIRGTWFSNDFQYLFRRYERIYAFFYATQPRFVRTIDTTLRNLLRAPWTGGFSRVNLFSTLAQRLPALHALKVNKLRFESPGEVRFEAIGSIGESIERATILYIQHHASIEDAYKKIRKTLTAAKVNKADLSKRNDQGVGLNEGQIAAILSHCDSIAWMLKLEPEIKTLKSHAPNTVVFAKAVNSLVRQIGKLAALQVDGMLNFPDVTN